jgi:hypothetical protein
VLPKIIYELLFGKLDRYRTTKNPGISTAFYPLSPWQGTSTGCGWRKHPPVLEGSCEYIE